jgi:diguanylate cyclase (GGDEF)-like protein
MRCRALSDIFMPSARTSFHELAHITEIAARAPHFASALETIVCEIGRVFQSDVYALERVDHQWSVAAATPQAPPISRTFLAQLTPPNSFTAAAHQDPAGREWLVISLSTPWAPSMALLLPDHQNDSQDLLSAWARLTAFAIGALRERDRRMKAEQLLGGGYSTARRLSRLGTVDVVAQRIVDEVARLLTAGRVALALYRPSDDVLTVVATHGYAIMEVEQTRIQPGSWVIGHVFSKGRPILVRDVRKVHGMAHDRRGYQSSSFAAVPIFAGPTTVGVLTATDKRDNSSFSRRDFMVLRTVSVVAGMALVAARSQTEAGRLAYAATVDALTGLLNRTSLDGRLHQEFERAKRAGNQLAVVMGDVDDFKTINDTHGHQIGDAVLQVVGAIIRSAVRVFDVCARYGGDEFAILMPSTDHASAAACAERIRRRVSEYRGDPVAPILPRLTMSVGVAVIEAGDTPAELILRADRALYQAKAAGKNCVRVHAPAGRPAPPGTHKEHA